MSQENVELFYRAVDAFNRPDLDAYLGLMDDDVEFVFATIRLRGHGSGSAAPTDQAT